MTYLFMLRVLIRDNLFNQHSKNLTLIPAFLLVLLMTSFVSAEVRQNRRPEIIGVATNINANNSLIIDFQVSLSQDAQLSITYENAAAGRFKYTPNLSSPCISSYGGDSFEQTFSIVRLRPETTYSYTLVATDKHGKHSKPFKGSFTTGSLPANLSTSTFTLAQGKGTTYPLTLIDLNPGEPVDPSDPFHGYVILDSEGFVVWFYNNQISLPNTTGLAAFNIIKLPNRNYLYELRSLGEGGDGRMIEITPFGEFVRISQKICTNLPLPVIGSINHDMISVKKQKILYLATLVESVSGLPIPQAGIPIREWNLKTNTDRQVWSPFDFLNPLVDRGPTSNNILLFGCNSNVEAQDWLHSNSLQEGLDGNYIYSAAALNQILSLGPSPDSRNREIALCRPDAVGRRDLSCRQWVLGGPGSDFSFPNQNDQFYFQHEPLQLPNRHRNRTNILMFDDGSGRPASQGGNYARALELELDFATMEARKVWEFRPQPPLSTFCCGNAIRLKNGNTVIDFATAAGKPPFIHIFEVDPQSQVVAEIDVSTPSVIYRAHVLDTIAGETKVKKRKERT